MGCWYSFFFHRLGVEDGLLSNTDCAIPSWNGVLFSTLFSQAGRTIDDGLLFVIKLAVRCYLKVLKIKKKKMEATASVA